MATAVLEDLPLPLELSSAPQYEAKESPSPDTMAALDWQATLSPVRRSCIKLSNVEPCVNKAIAHLSSLKERLAECASNQLLTTARQVAVPESQSDAPKSLFKEGDGRTSTGLHQGHSRQLMIEGVTTGIPIEKHNKVSTKKTSELGEDWPDEVDEVIASTVRLIGRLEHDRQETIENLCHEKARVQQLGAAVDIECEKRQGLLEVAVQQEHEECTRNIQELKWHVHLETRMLNKVLGELRLVVEKNEKLKNEVAKMTENSPLLEEKLIIENNHMAEIACVQQETSDRLNKTRHKLMQTEDKSTKTHAMADSERQQMRASLDDVGAKLMTAKKTLKEAKGDATSMTHQINDNLKKIADNEKKAKELDEKRMESLMLHSKVEVRVGLLKDDYLKMDVENRKHERQKESLEMKMASQHSKLENEHLVLKSAMQVEEKKLRQARDKNLDMEQENDSLRERIAAFTKQTQDDEKSVERAHRELAKLDQQMGVSVAQFTEIRENHASTSEEFRSEQAMAGEVENTLKGTIQRLQQQIKEQTRTKLTYSGKVNAVSAELEKVRAESKKKEERVERIARESEKQSQGQTDKVTKLEEDHSENARQLESLNSNLRDVQDEQTRVDREVGGRRDDLAAQERQLRAQVQEKVAEVNSVLERINFLERKLEDVVKSTTMLHKMEGVTNASIEQLDCQLSALKEKLAAERREEESWRDEFREVSEFSSDAEHKHAAYLKERTQLLKQNKLDLHKALSTNTSLAEHYRKQQAKFIEAKTLALQVMERKLDMESSLRDHKQLLAFQSCIYSTMKAYYEHRGSRCRRQVVQFHSQSKENMQQLKGLREQFETVIATMHEFLESTLSKPRPPQRTIRVTTPGVKVS